ncbi:MAG: phosphate ABC transporter permease subunit PstC [Chloroflexi bacterium]|nr:MAG: phosphate ABC transporter permease subunit PstC [Chloroflexota bacterium]PIE79752.1 MAG: phosphate ABC transporter permease subunit PstC [Chloroflexota bacterium]
MAPQSSASPMATPSSDRSLAKKPRIGETMIQVSLFACGVISIFTTIGIVLVLLGTALQFFALPEVTLTEFFTGTVWQPTIGKFGIMPLLLGTLMSSFIAMIVALPIGLLTAIYLSEYASSRTRNILKPVLEILAGIPTVVYGYFALQFMTQMLRRVLGQDTVQIFNVASAGIVVGILIIPLVTSLSEDAIHAVPDSLRQGALALGATRWETARQIIVPASLSGITAAFVVAISRAVGETMIVAIAAGAGPRNFELGQDSILGFVLNPFIAAETMTGHMVRISGGDLSYESVEYYSIFAIGLLLFVMTLGLNLIARRIVTRYREVYE